MDGETPPGGQQVEAVPPAAQRQEAPAEEVQEIMQQPPPEAMQGQPTIITDPQLAAAGTAPMEAGTGPMDRIGTFCHTVLGYIKDILFNPVPPKSDGPPNTRTDMQPHRNRPEVQTNILQDPLTHGLREAKRQETPAEREDKPPHTKQTELTENNRFEKAYTRRPLAQHRRHARGGQVGSAPPGY